MTADTRTRHTGSSTVKALIRLLGDFFTFALKLSLIKLRSYQIAPARAVINSVLNDLGLTIVIVMPRQSGKNELQAQLECYLLRRFCRSDQDMVKASPTWKPQSLNAMRRLERVLKKNPLTKSAWKKESGYIFRVGSACIAFLSGAPDTNIVGQTANLLLQLDEAQDIQIQKYDKDLVNMVASTNATRVFWGTMWTSKTLLAREIRMARQAEAEDGIRRVFIYNADDVRSEVPAYGRFVDTQVQRLGRNHPLIKSQLFSEEIDAEGGMFTTERRALMQGHHSWRETPEPDKIYAMLLDVAGEDEAATEDGDFELSSQDRNHTAVTIVEIDMSTLRVETVKAPTYRTVWRKEWIGDKHTAIYSQLVGIANHWAARWLVADATGVGAGLVSFLDKALPGKVIPFVFTRKSKSQLGWGFLAVVETGRYREYAPLEQNKLQNTLWTQVEYCQCSVVTGPDRTISWGVPDGTRDHRTGELVFDDMLVSSALCWVLDQQEWGTGESHVIDADDPFAGMDEVF